MSLNLSPVSNSCRMCRIGKKKRQRKTAWRVERQAVINGIISLLRNESQKSKVERERMYKQLCNALLCFADELGVEVKTFRRETIGLFW